MDTVNVELFGKDPRVLKALGHARNIAVTKAPTLIMGEPGVGKRALARYIHINSGRSTKPFEMVDCAGNPRDVENVILGHRDTETGRFNRGVLEAVNGGTVVFVNIDSLEESFQKRLHKIITELDDYDIDIRLIATTTKNLSKLVGAGRFYRGLFNALSSNTLSIPPLRERQGDVQNIVEYMASQFEGGRLTVANDAMEKLSGHYWAQNMSELMEVLDESFSNHGENLEISKEDLALGEKKITPIGLDEDGEGIALMSLKEAEKLLIKKALIHTSENRTQAAKILGVSIRTLRNKINEYRTEGTSYFLNLR